MFEKIEGYIEMSVKFVERVIGLILKTVFELAPVLFVLFIIVAVIIQVFKVVVLGETP
jgi:hypothetical protein